MVGLYMKVSLTGRKVAFLIYPCLAFRRSVVVAGQWILYRKTDLRPMVAVRLYIPPDEEVLCHYWSLR